MNFISGPTGEFLAQEVQFGDFTLDHSRYQLRRGDRPLHLEKRPMDLLILLVQRSGELVTRDEIAERLWGKPRYIETVVGKGYRFAAPVTHKSGGSTRMPESRPRDTSPPAPMQMVVGREVCSAR